MIIFSDLGVDGDPYEISLIDIPPDMPLLYTSESQINPTLTHRQLQLNRLPTCDMPISIDSLIPFRMRSSPASSGFLDCVTYGEDFDPDEQSPARPKKFFGRFSLDLSDWTMRNEVLAYPDVGADKDYPIMLFKEKRMFKSTHIVTVDSDGCRIIAPKFDDGYGHDPSWIQLMLPSDLKLPNSTFKSDRAKARDWCPSIYGFDVYTGKLYVRLPDGLHVLQY